MSDELDRLAPNESARNRARDKKIRGPKVVSVNPGLKKLAQHIADKRRTKKETADREAGRRELRRPDGRGQTARGPRAKGGG